MTPELARLMKNARDYPNTATVDHLCEGIRKTLELVQAAERMAAAVEREECAKIAERQGLCANGMTIAAQIRTRSTPTNHCRETEEPTCPKSPPS